MFIKPRTSPFFPPPLLLLLQGSDLPGGSHRIHWYKYSPYADISGLYF